MSNPKSPSQAKKKKRLVQLRDAQRRRRERLREDRQFFVQIILPEATLRQLARVINNSGETMQQAIARLLQSALPIESPDANKGEYPGEIPAEILAVTQPTAMEVDQEVMGQVEQVEKLSNDEIAASETISDSPDSSRPSAGQLDLF